MESDQRFDASRHTERLAKIQARALFWNAAYCFLVRFGRILAALGITAGAIWLFMVSGEMLGTPFSELSPLGLLGGLLAGVGALLVLVIAFGTAFGEIGSDEDMKKRIARYEQAYARYLEEQQQWKKKS